MSSTATLDREDTGTDIDLEAWLKGENEKPCEMHQSNMLTGYVGPCGAPAAWLARMRYTCDCRPWAKNMQRLVCDPCKSGINGVFACVFCTAPVDVTWIERIK